MSSNTHASGSILLHGKVPKIKKTSINLLTQILSSRNSALFNVRLTLLT